MHGKKLNLFNIGDTVRVIRMHDHYGSSIPIGERVKIIAYKPPSTRSCPFTHNGSWYVDYHGYNVRFDADCFEKCLVYEDVE